MANEGIPAGKRSLGKGVGVSKGKVNTEAHEGGFGTGIDKEDSLQQLPSNARVIKSASSNLMKGMSQSRGTGGNK